MRLAAVLSTLLRREFRKLPPDEVLAGVLMLWVALVACVGLFGFSFIAGNTPHNDVEDAESGGNK